MRISLFLVLAALVALPASNRAQRAAASAPCTTAAPGCTEWVTLGGGPSRSMIYRTFSLNTRNENIRRGLVMVHGTNRNADHYFSTAASAAFLAGALEDTVVISPRFTGCTDKLQPDEVGWSCNGDSWRSGGIAATSPTLSSFDFMDEIVRKLANKTVFPNLRAIVVTGHSAGGQFVTRYEMSNRVHDVVGPTRALPVDDAAPDKAKEGWNTEEPHTKFSYGPFDASLCPNFNRWPLGLQDRSSGYTAKMTEEQLIRQLVSRPTTYLLGQVDTLPLGGFDSSCPAMAQGATRRSRGEAFAKYVNEQLGAKHAIQIVPECGHNNRCVFTTDSVLPVIFPK
jgi:pimeloyl-ACP methyl ester carboxylesterase